MRELKKAVTFNEERDGKLQKEVHLEIDKIQRSVRKQFQKEFQTLLNKIETKGDKHRLSKYWDWQFYVSLSSNSHNDFNSQFRQEKADRLSEKLLKANYVYDV